MELRHYRSGTYSWAAAKHITIIIDTAAACHTFHAKHLKILNVTFAASGQSNS